MLTSRMFSYFKKTTFLRTYFLFEEKHSYISIKTMSLFLIFLLYFSLYKVLINFIVVYIFAI